MTANKRVGIGRLHEMADALQEMAAELGLAGLEDLASSLDQIGFEVGEIAEKSTRELYDAHFPAPK